MSMHCDAIVDEENGGHKLKVPCRKATKKYSMLSRNWIPRGELNPILLNSMWDVMFQEKFDPVKHDFGGYDYNQFFISKKAVRRYPRSWLKHVVNGLSAAKTFQKLPVGLGFAMEKRAKNDERVFFDHFGRLMGKEKKKEKVSQRTCKISLYENSSDDHSISSSKNSRELKSKSSRGSFRSFYLSYPGAPVNGRNEAGVNFYSLKFAKIFPKIKTKHIRKGAENQKLKSETYCKKFPFSTSKEYFPFSFISKRTDLTSTLPWNKDVCHWFEQLWHVVFGHEGKWREYLPPQNTLSQHSIDLESDSKSNLKHPFNGQQKFILSDNTLPLSLRLVGYDVRFLDQFSTKLDRYLLTSKERCMLLCGGADSKKYRLADSIVEIIQNKSSVGNENDATALKILLDSDQFKKYKDSLLAENSNSTASCKYASCIDSYSNTSSTNLRLGGGALFGAAAKCDYFELEGGKWKVKIVVPCKNKDKLDMASFV